MKNTNHGLKKVFKLDLSKTKRSRVGKKEFHPQASPRTMRETLALHGSSQLV